MNITTDEIARLLRVVSEPLRTNWEKNVIDGKSLVETKLSRDEALQCIEKNRKKTLYFTCAMGLLSIVALVIVAIIFKNGTINLLTVLAVFAPTAFVLSRWSIQTVDAKDVTIPVCEERFAKFQESVRWINPLMTGNTHHDIINEEYVKAKLETLAYRVLDAEHTFHKERIKKDVSHFTVTRCGQWIVECQETFDKSWGIATQEFGLTLEKGEIYSEAKKAFEARR